LSSSPNHPRRVDGTRSPGRRPTPASASCLPGRLRGPHPNGLRDPRTGWRSVGAAASSRGPPSGHNVDTYARELAEAQSRAWSTLARRLRPWPASTYALEEGLIDRSPQAGVRSRGIDLRGEGAAAPARARRAVTGPRAATRRELRRFLGLHGRPRHAATRRVSAPPARITATMLKNGKAPPALAGGAQLAPRTAIRGWLRRRREDAGGRSE
jgi:hypothetical protein